MRCAKNKCHARPTATNSVDYGMFEMAILTCRLFDEEPKTQRFTEKLLLESLLPVLKEQRIGCVPTTENNVVEYKSKSISVELYCCCRQPWFSKDGTIGTNKWPNGACIGDSFTECVNVSLERSLRIKVVNGIA